MTSGAKLIATFYLITRVCFTSGILPAKGIRDSSPISVRPSEINNRVATIRGLSASVPVNEATNNGVKLIELPRGLEPKIGYLYLNPSTIEFQLPSREVSKTPFNHQSYRRPSGKLGSPRGPGSSSSSSSSSISGSRSTTRTEAEVGHEAEVHQGSSYQVVEELDEYVTAAGDSDHDELVGYRGKMGSTYQPLRDTQELTNAIKALDHFLSGILNGHGYNSPLHPPNNPLLSLVLSRYGRYVPVVRNARAYAYNAVNNIHNNQPFGKYKQECEDEPIYVHR